MGIVKIILPSAIIFKTFKNAPQCGFNSLQLKGALLLSVQ